VPSCIFLVPSCHQSQHLLRGGLMSHRLSVRLKFRKSSNFLTVCHLSKTERKYRLFRTLRQSFKLIVLVFRRNRGQSGTRRKNTVCAVKIGRLCLQHKQTKYLQPKKQRFPATKKLQVLQTQTSRLSSANCILLQYIVNLCHSLSNCNGIQKLILSSYREWRFPWLGYLLSFQK